MKKGLREKLRMSYQAKRGIIRARLEEFREVYRQGDDGRIFEELAFCICTAGASARMGLRSVEALKDILLEGSLRKFKSRLKGIHRFPNYRPDYIIHTREYLRREHGLRLRDLIESFPDPHDRRDFFARNRYIAVEKSLRQFADDIGIPMDELDLLLWSEKTGEILK